MNIEIKFNTGMTQQKVAEEIQRKQRILDSIVLRDSNLFCPKDTGALQDSGVNSTVIGSGSVEWHTPYAARQYYNWRGGRDSRNRNPRATSKWFETAKAIYGDKWLEAIGAEHS